MKLGFYAGAEDAFRREQNPQGLLQSLLAQRKTQQARNVLALEMAQKLNRDQREFYTTLATLQEGTQLKKIGVNAEGLDARERTVLWYVNGLRAFTDGDFAGAEAIWRELPAEAPEALWVSALLQGSIADEQPKNSKNPLRIAAGMFADKGKEVEGRLKKVRRQDWPLVKNYCLAMIAQGNGERARKFLGSNTKRWPENADEAGLIAAISYAPKTAERAEALMKLLPTLSKPEIITAAVGFCLEENAVNLNDVEQQLGEKKKEAATALILAQAWTQKGSFNRAYELLSGTGMENALPAQWKEAYYSTLATLACSGTSPRYREAANALMKRRELPEQSAEQKALLQAQIGDMYLKNGDFADAAAAYEKESSTLPQAVMAWLKADKPKEAQRILAVGFAGAPEARLAYLMDVRQRGENVEEAAKLWSVNGKNTVAALENENWPVEYLRVEGMAATDPKGALEYLEGLKFATVEGRAPEYKVYFDLQKYHLLRRMKNAAQADAMLDEITRGGNPPKEFLLIAIEKALMEHKPEMVMALIESGGAAGTLMGQNGVLNQTDRVGLMLLVAEALGNKMEVLEKVQMAVEALPSAERMEKLSVLARRYAVGGNLEKARSIVDALQESSMDGTIRDEVDFLRATIDELRGDPVAEAELRTLGQREEPSVRMRGLARLAAYYAQHDRAKDARTIFYAQLAPLTTKPLPREFLGAREEIAKAFVALSKALPEVEAAKVLDWVETLGEW